MALNRLAIFSIATIVYGLPLQCRAADPTTQCPTEIETTQTLSTQNSNWENSIDDTKHPMLGIRFSDGPPAEIAWLVPDRTETGGVQTWVLPKSDRGYWVSCSYANTKILLSKRLAATTGRCRVWYDKGYAVPVAIRYECK